MMQFSIDAYRSFVVATCCAFCSTCSVNQAENSDGPWVEVRTFSISPTSIAVDETFTVGWDIERSGAAGYATTFGLYVGGADTLSTDEARQARKIFSRGAGGVTMSLRDMGSLDCVYHGSTNIDCGPLGQSPSESIGGSTRLTLLACDSNVVPPYDEACDSQEVDVEFAIP